MILSPPYRCVPWKNGLGTTLELATDALSEGGAWTWRLSIADVPCRAAFSSFPGVTRHINCLHGEGLVLHRSPAGGKTPHGKRERAKVPRVGNGFVFEGEEQVDGEPLGPGVQDINLMVNRAQWTGALSIERDELSAGVMSSGTIIFHYAQGAAPLELTVHGEGQTVQLEVGSTLITSGLVTITPRKREGKDSCTLVIANLWPRSARG